MEREKREREYDYVIYCIENVQRIYMQISEMEYVLMYFILMKSYFCKSVFCMCTMTCLIFV